MWRITSTPKLGYRQADLQIKACSASSFSPGDFVQVIVKVIALAQRGKYNTPADVTVRFDLLSCIRLLTSKEANNTLPRDTDKVPAIDPPVPSDTQDQMEDVVDEGPDML
ncbi:unnamed protein product [Peniophora sp. CBMAI 1063]|nr:unnamed protein product [Peniophora sp. CBMAI 1063]